MLHAASGRGINKKRTSIEIQMKNEKVSKVNGVWRWADTHQQLADGVTKLGEWQFVERLRSRVHALRWDSTSTPGKKIERPERERELDDAAEDVPRS